MQGQIQEIRYEKVTDTWEGKPYDIDRYTVETRTALATHEYSVGINHANQTIFGDVVHYGTWDDLSEEEVISVLKSVEAKGELKRPYKDYTFSE